MKYLLLFVFPLFASAATIPSASEANDLSSKSMSQFCLKDPLVIKAGKAIKESIDKGELIATFNVEAKLSGERPSTKCLWYQIEGRLGYHIRVTEINIAPPLKYLITIDWYNK